MWVCQALSTDVCFSSSQKDVWYEAGKVWYVQKDGFSLGRCSILEWEGGGGEGNLSLTHSLIHYLIHLASQSDYSVVSMLK